jgi:hypothetical protein
MSECATKRCGKCHASKPWSAFQRAKHKSHGLSWACRDCTNGMSRERHRKRRAAQRDLDAEPEALPPPPKYKACDCHPHGGHRHRYHPRTLACFHCQTTWWEVQDAPSSCLWKPREPQPEEVIA